MSNKNQTAAQKAAAQKKADEVAALMDEDSETTSVEQTAPPEIKEPTLIVNHQSDETDGQKNDEGDDSNSGETHDQDDDESNGQGGDDTDNQEGDESDGQGGDENDDDYKQMKVVHLVVLSKTIHTKDKAGNDVKFIASKEPQDLGEYSETAIKAGLAKAVTS